MSSQLTPPDPRQYGLASFAELLGAREPIIGETTMPFAPFHDGLHAFLNPATAYEAVIAEDLIDIEWQLYQQRRMRDAILRDEIRKAIVEAVVNREQNTFRSESYDARRAWKEAGNKEEDFAFDEFDRAAAREMGEALASRLVDESKEFSSEAEQELTALGLDAVTLMAEIYQKHSYQLEQFNDRIEDLERRRRQVRADLDALQAVRSRQPQVIDG
jgi:hypothetical protein